MATNIVQMTDGTGNKQYPITSAEAVGMPDGSGNLTNYLDKRVTEYNVSVLHPTSGSGGSNKYTLETAIAQVPSKYRSVGIKCAFINESGKPECWKYQGGSWVVGSFVPVEVINELNISFLYPTNGVGGTNKYDLATAITRVPAEYRNIQGLKITFINNTTGKTETWKYDGGTFTSTASWKQGDGNGGNKTLDWAGDVASTRKQVLSQDRKKLLQISYTNADGEIVNEQYKSTNYTDTEWVKDGNWSKLLDSKSLESIFNNTPEIKDNTLNDFCISDENNNSIFKIGKGYPYTKEFDGERIAKLSYKIQDAIFIQKEDLTPNSYYGLSVGVGSIAPESPDSYAIDNTWWSFRSEVYKGATVFLKTKGGQNGRAYALTDKDRVILRVADANADYTSEGIYINVEEDGYLYINCTGAAAYSIFTSHVTYNDTQKIKLQVDSNTNYINVVGKINSPRKILSISNSYGCDALGYLPMILESIGITDIELGIAYIGSASLQQHFDNLTSGQQYGYNYNLGSSWLTKSLTLPEIISDKDWDCIVFQQVSNNSGKYETYEPYLTGLMRYCMSLKPVVKFAFNMTQPYANGYSGLGSYGSQENMFDGIKSAAINVHYNNGLTIIPTGVAIQLARETELNDYGNFSTHQLSIDGSHLDDGIGRYVAGLTWIVSLLGIPVWTVKYKPEYPLAFKLPDGPRGTFQTVTEDMASIAKLCAHQANNHLNKILITNNL